MNETMKTLLSRRSIRKYKDEQINDADLQAILEAGRFAPSAMNQQSWHFTVVQNKEMLQKMNNACVTAFSKSGIQRYEEWAKIPNFNIFHHAPTVIIVSGDQKAIAPHSDGSLALGNMFIAAESLGIGSCWINALNFLFSKEESQAMKEELGIPEGYIPIGSGSFGYKGMEQPTPAPRKEGTVNIIK